MILDSVFKAGISKRNVAMSVEHTGNTGNATLPLALHELHARGGLEHGERILLASMGPGQSWASTVYAWHDPAAARAARAGEQPVLKRVGRYVTDQSDCRFASDKDDGRFREAAA